MRLEGGPIATDVMVDDRWKDGRLHLTPGETQQSPGARQWLSRTWAVWSGRRRCRARPASRPSSMAAPTHAISAYVCGPCSFHEHNRRRHVEPAAGGGRASGHCAVARDGPPRCRTSTPTSSSRRRIDSDGISPRYLANRLTDVGRTADGRHVDQVISLRWPSYAVRHPAHVSWLNHTAREYYDLWDRFSAGLSSANRVKEQVRRSIIQRDRQLAARART